MDKTTRPAIIVIFGITGDLAQRKLLPALYHLSRDGLLDERTVILGITRRDVTTQEMVAQIEASIKAADGSCEHEPLTRIQSALHMHTMSQTEPQEYRDLKQLLDDIEAEKGICMDRLYYLSIPPQMFGPIVRNLGEQGLNQSCQHGNAASRLLVEKPFGYDLASARELLTETSAHFSEDQTFRIDHYMAKDAVQNIVAFRRAVPGIEEIWNSTHVSRIEVTVFEKLGIEGRAVFYEEVGALRDFVQSHLLQVLALAAMDLPAATTSDAVHTSRLQLLEAIVPVHTADVPALTVRAQYEGYRDEVGSADSHTETFARVHLTINSDRWQGTTFSLQTGKAMSEKKAEVRAFLAAPGGEEQSITFWIEPEKGIELAAGDPALTDLHAAIHAFNQAHPAPTENALGYERVFQDAIAGDHTVFTSADEVITAWKIMDDIVKAWSKNGDGLISYPKGAAAIDA